MKFKQFDLFLITILIFLVNISTAQHRGDNLAFQGLYNNNDLGVKATAMGGAITASSGDIMALFGNPAGLIGIDKIQVSVAANYSNNNWRENQDYRPNRYFVTLPFYLEGLYVPDPAQNGMWDHERMWTENMHPDSSYYLAEPELGLDQFSEEAADWKRDADNFALNNIAVALPLNLGEHKIVLAAAYNRDLTIEDYDRNSTYLDPHIGFSGYNDIFKVDGIDTLAMNWSNFVRQRSGSVNCINAAVAYDLNKYFNVGVGYDFNWGSSDDYQSMDLIGAFDLMDENRFRFSYLDTFTEKTGTSDYTYNKFYLGTQLQFDNFAFGVKIDLPYTITREWDYTETYSDSVANRRSSLSGEDKIDIPALFEFGIKFSPVDNFSLSLDYSHQPFSESEVDLGSDDETYRNLPDRNIIKAGLEYKPVEFLSLLGGYRNIPSMFIPDGAAITESGPEADSYTFGFALDLLMGRVELAYEIRKLKYYDSYFSNANYVTETYSNLLFGYVFQF